MTKIRMRAPKGTTSANIEGHAYEVEDGLITVVNEAHVSTLTRHGFTEHFDPVEEEDIDVDAMDKEELIQFIEERGGDTDGMTKKQLRAEARRLIEE